MNAKNKERIDYFNKLIGNRISDSQFQYVHDKIKSVTAVSSRYHGSLPNGVRYLTESGQEFQLDYIIVYGLVEHGIAHDPYGNQYKIVD